jgi:hypothetical protein
VKDCFKDLPSLKDGYSIEDCKDPRHRRLLAFLVPIVYPEKPNRITVTWGNTIFRALNGGRKVNWARVITTLVIQLAARVGKSRATPSRSENEAGSVSGSDDKEDESNTTQ